jgi:two-component system sensor histidine kinase/response regulator
MIDTETADILIVDDVMDNLDLLAEMLKKQGHAVRIARSGSEALDVIHAEPPDLVLLDILMPGMDGYEVCERIKADSATAEIPVIFLSAHAETDDILRGFDVGGVDYVGKPFQFREVAARVNNQLALSQQRKRLVQQREEIVALRERDKRQFEQLNAMQERFLHATAHDLKNPLTTISLYVQMLEAEASQADSDDLRQIAGGIRQSSEKMRTLITDILDLAQMQIGLELQFFPAEIQTVIREAASNFDLIAAEADVTLTLNLPDEPVTLSLDVQRMERVFDNLLSNAIKYTPAGGEVTVSLDVTDDTVQVRVRDTGIGIPEDDLPHLFEAFYRIRTKTHQKQSGNGLGLAIVRAIIEQHNGQIDAQSVPGEGSVFTVALPC